MRVVRQIDGIIFPVGMTYLPLSTCCVDMFLVDVDSFTWKIYILGCFL